MQLLILLVQRQPLVGDIGEGGGDDDDRPGRGQLPNHAAADHLPLPARQEHREARGPRGRRRWEEGTRERQDLEPAVQRHHGPGRGRLPEADVGHRAAPAEDADPALPPPRVHGHALEDVAPAADLEDVRPERVGALPGDDDRRLRLVLRARGPAPGPAGDEVAGPMVPGGAEIEAVVVGSVILGFVGILVVIRVTGVVPGIAVTLELEVVREEASSA